MKRIGGLFGRSPFGPLHEHMAKVQECVEQLPTAIDYFLNGKWTACSKHAEIISRIEHEADQIKQDIRANLTSSIFSSVERAEILAILKTQDAVADRCEDVAHLLVMRKTPFPSFLGETFQSLVQKVKETTDRLAIVTRELHKVYDATGQNHEAAQILEQIDLIHKAEHDADDLEATCRAKLFEREKEVDPVTIMLLLDIFLKTGHIADAAENVGDAVRSWIETR